MDDRPFLVNFAVKRNQRRDNDLSTYYDENLELNVFKDKRGTDIHSDVVVEHLSTMTKTFVKSEGTDSDRNLGQHFPGEPNHQIFVGTQTLTEVSNERADRDVHDDHLVFLATQTCTKTAEERSDRDV